MTACKALWPTWGHTLSDETVGKEPDALQVAAHAMLLREQGTEQLAQNNLATSSDTGTLNGVGVTDLDQQTRQQFNLPDTVRGGAVITQVKPDSASAEAGLKPGDVIEEINHHAVRSAEDAVRLTENAKNKHTLVRVWENGASHYVVVDESGQAG